MKKGLLTVAMAIAAMGANATVITDTVATGASYANQVWYSLPNDEQGTRPKAEWDIAIDIQSITSGVLINSVNSITLWKYTKNNLANGWAAPDTTGISTWTAHYNSDTAWNLGAIGRYANPNDPYNLDWGTYNITNHVVTGDSLYIIKLSTGAYKKFAITSLNAGVYTFQYADLNGNNAQTKTITKTDYTGKNFAYFNLTTNLPLDREPATANWDLVFTQYSTFLTGAGYYTVTGVLQNTGLKAVKVNNLPDLVTNVNYSGKTFSSQINTIGYDWKSFTGTAYVVKDSQLYFVQRTNGDIWKVIFKGFSGSATGSFIFSKEKIFTKPTAVPQVSSNIASMVIYPNPAKGQDIHVIYDLQRANNTSRIAVYDMAGRMVYAANAATQAGLNQQTIPAGTFSAGTYVVSIATEAGSQQQKLVVQ